MLKTIIINNLISLILYVVTISAYALIAFSLEWNHKNWTFTVELILTITILLIWFFSFYFLVGFIIIKNSSWIINFFSVALIFFIGVYIWIFFSLRTPIVGNYVVSYGDFGILFPVSKIFDIILDRNYKNHIGFIYTIIPTLVFFAGISLRNNK